MKIKNKSPFPEKIFLIARANKTLTQNKIKTKKNQ